MFRLLLLLLCTLTAVSPCRADYASPYSVKFQFADDDLTGDLTKGPRGDLKHESADPFATWYNTSNEKRWGHWGPPALHFPPPAGMNGRSKEWLRERVVATALRFTGYTYQHHHVPDWNPPEAWKRDPEQKTPVAKGLDCSNFTAFAYNQGLGIKPTGEVVAQSEMTTAPMQGRSLPVTRIELPKTYAEFDHVLKTGDLLYITNKAGKVSHVVIWVGKIGHSPDGSPLVLDSTGTGAVDSKGTEIPNGVHLRPFKPTVWYFKHASHALRIVPDGE